MVVKLVTMYGRTEQNLSGILSTNYEGFLLGTKHQIIQNFLQLFTAHTTYFTTYKENKVI